MLSYDQYGQNRHPIYDQKRLKNHAVWGGTYLYNKYKGAPPLPPPPPAPIQWFFPVKPDSVQNVMLAILLNILSAYAAKMPLIRTAE